MLIVLYTGYHSKHWNPESYLTTGLGGTEQALFSLAYQLAIKGSEIYVVGEIIEGDYGYPIVKTDKYKVKYRSIENFKKEIGNKKIDWIIAASYIHYLKEFEDLKVKTIHSLSGINESMDDITTKKLQETINQIKGEEFSKINYVRLYNLYNNIN